MTEKNKKNKFTQISSADSAALGNKEILEQVEVTTSASTEDKKNLHKEDPDIFGGQKPDKGSRA